MKVPFLDLKAQHLLIKDEIAAGLARVLSSASFVLGAEVEAFEKEFAEYCEAKYCVALNSGTSALHVALLCKGIGPGDEVITVPNTFIATAEAISYTGATPVFVDIVPETFNIDVRKIEAAITDRTRAIVPVHLYGQPVDMDPIMEIAREHGLAVVEDACQAHGALYKGRNVGSIGDIGCFSFYPGKNLGAYGEGGALVTDDEEVYRLARLYRDHGSPKKYLHDVIGYNYRMDGFQGAVLRAKLQHLDGWTAARVDHAKRYDELLSEHGVPRARQAEFANSVYHLYVVRVKDRDNVLGSLAADGIGTGIHYPICIHQQKAYSHLGLEKGSFPEAEKAASEVVSLPMFAELKEEQIKYVVDRLISAIGKQHGDRG